MGRGRSIPEDDGLAAVCKNSSVQVPGYCPGEHATLDVPTLADQILRCVTVRDALDVLFDDRPFIEVGCNIVSGGSDQFHAARMSLMIRPRSLETRQE